MTASGQIFASGSAPRSGPELAKALEFRLPQDPLTRFAPAPTGALHLGHVVNAVYVWGLARALGGRVLLRIEDHDRQRARGEAERLMLDDLDWLGLAADIYPSEDYRRGRCIGRQSERDSVYRGALAPLIASGLVYGCQCSRASQAAAGSLESAEADRSAERRYAGTCSALNLPPRDGVGWRLRLEPGVEAFEDTLLGPQQQDPSAQCGDLLLRDRLGNWTYQCAAAIDDAVQGVTLVVRGRDLLSSTGRQIRLARLVGRQTPAVFVHHPLIMKSATQKLSKSDGDSGIRDLRSAGWTAQQVIGRAAALAGLTPEPDPLSVGDLRRLFEVGAREEAR
jgi:glutamyl-tRNA synthetase/glutamyl-Q tRNA(Asp) synthetase